MENSEDSLRRKAKGQTGRLPRRMFALMRFILRLIARLFLSPIFPSTARKRILQALEKNRLARYFVLRLPPRAQLGDAVFLTDVGPPTVTSRLGFWTGAHEAPERRLVSNLLPGVPILEIGAGVGVVSHAAWRAADCPLIVVVEANPSVLEILRANLRENNVPATVEHSALAYGGAYAEIVVEDEWIAGSVRTAPKASGSRATGLQVPAITLERLLDEHFDSCSQVQLILDIEGGEWELLEREGEMISKRVVRVIAELHGNEDTAGLLERGRRAFAALGFKEVDTDANVACYGIDLRR